MQDVRKFTQAWNRLAREDLLLLGASAEVLRVVVRGVDRRLGLTNLHWHENVDAIRRDAVQRLFRNRMKQQQKPMRGNSKPHIHVLGSFLAHVHELGTVNVTVRAFRSHGRLAGAGLVEQGRTLALVAAPLVRDVDPSKCELRKGVLDRRDSAAENAVVRELLMKQSVRA